MLLIVPKQVSFYKLVGKSIHSKAVLIFNAIHNSWFIPDCLQNQLLKMIKTSIYTQIFMALHLNSFKDINAENIEQVLKIIQNVSFEFMDENYL